MGDHLDESMWGSWYPAVLAAIGATPGPVLEVGIGHLSTPSLHALLGAQRRELVSVEDNVEWYDKFALKYGSPLHKFILSDYLPILPDLIKHHWSVSFIDSSPGGKMRADIFSALIPVSDFVIVHDFHSENKEHIGPLISNLRWHVTETYFPPTLIASEKLEIPDSIRYCL